MKALNGKSYPWLEKTGQIWKYDLEGYIGIFGAIALGLLILSLVASVFISRVWIIGVSLMLLYLIFGFCSVFVFYYLIRCPVCGHNPTRTANGKWASSIYLEGKFRKMENCPVCEKQRHS